VRKTDWEDWKREIEVETLNEAERERIANFSCLNKFVGKAITNTTNKVFYLLFWIYYLSLLN